MTVGTLIILSILGLALIGGWKLSILFRAIQAMLIFERDLDRRLRQLEGRGPNGGGNGGPH